ncbi:hypothetical protein NDI56_17060 [Haloarcula sp. S1CR25-12]|uniref:Uncharacterized protein n=1 Tax=Haloarcula saliterrae TaxID=2950534 RepID=A0ABU2FH95_9EURY|nr:hypothetical protein [Haloarcula sp. S1CR25-12]MDS0261111.1 hypothetical protein [Haloarcula sp. S1CR25-12]
MVTLGTLIKGGTVVTGDAMFDAAVGISDGTIAGIGMPEALPRAERFGPPAKGRIEPGVTDLVVFDPAATYTISAGRNYPNAGEIPDWSA